MSGRFSEQDLIDRGFVPVGNGAFKKAPSKPVQANSSKALPNPKTFDRKGQMELIVNRPKGTGKDLEKTIDEIADRYRDSGTGIDIEKVDPPTKIVNKGGKLKAIMLTNPFLDYIGSLKRGKRAFAIHIEAKSTKCVDPIKNGRLRVNQKGGITERQFRQLRRWHRSGCLVGVVWQCGNMIRWASFRKIATTTLRGVKHLKFTECEPIHSGRGVTHDFIANLERDYLEK